MEIRLIMYQDEQAQVNAKGKKASMNIAEQIDRRLTHLETGQRELQAGQRWIMGLVFISWVTTMVLIALEI